VVGYVGNGASLSPPTDFRAPPLNNSHQSDECRSHSSLFIHVNGKATFVIPSNSGVIPASSGIRGPFVLFYLYNTRNWPVVSHAINLIKMDSLPSEIILYITTCKHPSKALEHLSYANT
jgi:hypothetical protein